MQVLGVGDDGEKDQQRERVNPPEGAGGGRAFRGEERGQVGDHQQEDEAGDDAGLDGDLFAQPARADEEAADEEAEDADGAGEGEGRGGVEVDAAEPACRVQKGEAEAVGPVVQRDQNKGAEAPEDEGVGQAGQGALADDFGLAEDFGEEVPRAAAHVIEVEAGIFPRLENPVQDRPKAAPEERKGACGQSQKKRFLRQREVLGLGQRRGKENDRQTTHDTRRREVGTKAGNREQGTGNREQGVRAQGWRRWGASASGVM